MGPKAVNYGSVRMNRIGSLGMVETGRMVRKRGTVVGLFPESVLRIERNACHGEGELAMSGPPYSVTFHRVWYLIPFDAVPSLAIMKNSWDKR